MSIIGKDVWWDTKKHIFRHKKLNLEKIPLEYRCPLCGAVVVPLRQRHPLIQEVTDTHKIWCHNKKVLDKYFKRDNPPREKFEEWENQIRTEHKDEFLKHIRVAHISEPITLVINEKFYGIYACDKCVKNRPSTYVLKEAVGTTTRFTDPTPKEKHKLKEQEQQKKRDIKYGKEPKTWVDFRWIENPEWRAWYLRKIEIDDEEKRKKNAKLVESQVLEIECGRGEFKRSDSTDEEYDGDEEVKQ